MRALTVAQLEELVNASVEPAEPWQTIAEVLDAHAGKPLTKRHLAMIEDRLPVEWEGSRVLKTSTAGMTHIEVWKGGKYEDRRSILIAYQLTNVPCPPRQKLEGLNTCYFEARQARNLRRLDLLKDPEALARMADVLARLTAARREFEELTAYGAPFAEVESELNPRKR